MIIIDQQMTIQRPEYLLSRSWLCIMWRFILVAALEKNCLQHWRAVKLEADVLIVFSSGRASKAFSWKCVSGHLINIGGDWWWNWVDGRKNALNLLSSNTAARAASHWRHKITAATLRLYSISAPTVQLGSIWCQELFLWQTQFYWLKTHSVFFTHIHHLPTFCFLIRDILTKIKYERMTD